MVICVSDILAWVRSSDMCLVIYYTEKFYEIRFSVVQLSKICWKLQL